MAVFRRYIPYITVMFKSLDTSPLIRYGRNGISAIPTTTIIPPIT
ncbi:hypothetical protein Lac2_04610 [Claveliimonas bilis]|nr:hypothetical protein Lac2_04610 [Claveliimonas bilis]